MCLVQSAPSLIGVRMPTIAHCPGWNTAVFVPTRVWVSDGHEASDDILYGEKANPLLRIPLPTGQGGGVLVTWRGVMRMYWNVPPPHYKLRRELAT
jgi:hypothetical protein